MNNAKRYMTISEVAAHFGKNPTTIYRMMRLGRLYPSVRQGRGRGSTLLFLRTKIERLSWRSLFRLPKHRKLHTPDGYLTQSQVARLLDKSPNIISILVRDGRLVPDLVISRRRLFRADTMATFRLESLYKKRGGKMNKRTIAMTLKGVPPPSDEELADLRGYILKTIPHDTLMERFGCRTRQRLSQRMQELAYRKIVHDLIASQK